MSKQEKNRYPGIPAVLDGAAAVVHGEREAADAAVCTPASPAARMGALWSREVGAARLNLAGRPLRRLEAATERTGLPTLVGLAMTGLRATGFFSDTGLLRAHEALLAAAGRHLPLVLHLACRAPARFGGGLLPSHEAYHALADSGCVQFMAKDAQAAADLALIARQVAELALVPALVAQDGQLTTERLQSLRLPEPELIAEFLGLPETEIEAPTEAQNLLHGPRRRRVPEPWSVDNPALTGADYGPAAYPQGAAAQGLYHLGHAAHLIEDALEQFHALTGRRHDRLSTHRVDDADYLLVAQGSAVAAAEAVADHLRAARRLKVGVVGVTLLRPFPGDQLGRLLERRKGVVVLERLDSPLAEDPPLLREVRAAVQKCHENGQAARGEVPFPGYPAYRKPEHAPPLFAASYGVGGGDPAPGGLIAAVENMLPGGARHRRGWLGLDFLADAGDAPKREIYLQTLADAYPAAAGLALAGGEAPDLLPQGGVALRMYQTAGAEVFTPEDNLATTLFELKGGHVLAGSSPGAQVGGPAPFHLAAAAEPVRFHGAGAVDVVLAPDADAFRHADPLAGLKAGGALIIQSGGEDGEALWVALPPAARTAIRERGIRLFAIDARRIATEEARDPETQRRVVSHVFQGCALATPPLQAFTGLGGRELQRALKQVLLERTDFSDPSEVDEDLRVLKRGMDEMREVEPGPAPAPEEGAAGLPAALKGHPVNPVPAYDLHRFWEQTGSGYATGAPDNLAEPFIGAGLLPAGSGLLRDLAATRAEYPNWIPEVCTGCGECWMICPDASLPGLVSTPGQVLQAAVAGLEARGVAVEHLPRAVRALEGKWRERIAAAGEGDPIRDRLPEAMAETLPTVRLSAAQKEELQQEFDALLEEIGDFRLAVTAPFFSGPEGASAGSGGLLSVTLDPSKCKGCMACVSVCPEQALSIEPQPEEVLAALRRAWTFQRRLPTTDAAFITTSRGADGEPGPGTLLLDKRAYHSSLGGDDGAPGALERSALHLFSAALTAAMQPRVAAHVAHIEELTGRLEQHVRMHLAVDAENPEALQAALNALGGQDFTLGELSDRLDHDRKPVDAAWLRRVTGLLAGLKRLRWLYGEGPGGQGRAALGMAAGPEPGAPWGAAYPFNPFPFPWSALPPEETAGLAEGLFEGHMALMAEGFRAIRMTELELDEKFNPDVHEPFFARFGWRAFTEEELQLCPPVVAVGGDGALHGAGLESLAALLRGGKPVKVLCLDTQAWSALEGVAAEFAGPPEGQPPPQAGLQLGGARHDVALLAIAQGGAYVAQQSLAHPRRMLEEFLAGLDAPGPALFNVFCGRTGVDGARDGSALRQAGLAVDSRAHPLFSFDPARGEGWHERLLLEGNPAPDGDWAAHILTHRNGSGEETSEAELTFADFAATVPALRLHFRVAPREAKPESLVPLAEYLELDAEEREEVRPCISVVDHEGRLTALLVSRAIVRASEERRAAWRLLHTLTRQDIVPVDEEAIAEGARAEVVDKVTQSLLEMAASPAGLAGALTEMATSEGDGGEREEPGGHA